MPNWINTARAAQRPGNADFACGLTSDLEAVIAELTLQWSSGGAEDAVTRGKKIRRRLYGRAGFERVRKMILLQ
ncbi:hypothetical protein ABZ848_41630 [Streptomyces sp. NPDC047081]|uniref:hypothetical protein n=1 Tax=Streptomyces sp. NPDC047081 TaxID=3154706 RepID=UPI0033D12142